MTDQIFDGIVSACGGQKQSDGSFNIHCPAEGHEDKNPSCNVKNAGDKVLLNCYAGCSQDAVISGLKARNLWPENSGSTYTKSGIPAGIFPSWGKREKKPYVQHWNYHDAFGNIIGYTVRYQHPGVDDKDVVPYFKPAEKPFGCMDPAPRFKPGYNEGLRPLYNLHLLYRDMNSDHKRTPILVSEGEKATDASKILVGLHYIPITWPGGSKAVNKANWSVLKNYDVFMWPDADEPGKKAVLAVQKKCAEAGVKTFRVIQPPEGVKSGWDLADAAEEGWDAGQAMDHIKTSAGDPGPWDWEPIVPLESDTAPPIDPEALPGTLRDIVVDVARATETPSELGTGMGLAVLATCCQGKMRIEPTPDYWEPLCLFSVTALDSGNRKSGVTNTMTAPLRAAELEMWAKAEPFIKELASRQKNIESRLKSLRAKYGKAKPGELSNIEGEIRDLERQVEPIPPLPRLWADDVTPEHLGTMMHQHNERMSILSAEGGIFDILGGRYSNGIPNMEIFLKSHACEPGRADRGCREPVFLDAPCLTIGLAPQPAVLHELAGKPGFRGRGLLARFLYFLPVSRLGYRTLKTDPVQDHIKQAWGNLIARLLTIEPRLDEHDRETPYIIKLSTEALSEWEEFGQAVEVEMRPGGRFEPIKDWAGKLPGAAARIAGLFHCIDNPGAPWAEKVTGETMHQALNLSAAYADHALVAFGLMGGDPALEGAKKIWRWIETGRNRQFSRRDCFQALRGTFTRVKEIEEPMSVLIERNYVRAETVKTGGRPTEVVTVNPELVRRWA
jgi:hypothetical protein